jgi:hypothetical protein
MRHERHYTLEQANAVRPWVARRVGWIRDGQARIQEMGERAAAAVGALDPAVGGSYPDRDVARCLVEISRAVGELEAVDIVLRDVDRGLVDFPAIRDDEEIYLCWLVEEDEIRFWHHPDAGFAGRRPL